MEPTTTLVKYSMLRYSSEDQDDVTRTALYTLLMAAANAVKNGEPERLTEFSEITLTLERSGWDSMLVFRLEAVERLGVK